MKIVVQRVLQCSVHVQGRHVSSFDGPGVLALIGIARGDDATLVDWAVGKLLKTRLFDGETGKPWQRSLLDCGATHSVMCVSQFTLFGAPPKGRGHRLDFHKAMPGPEARVLFDSICARVEATLTEGKVCVGAFGEDMKVGLTNDGPVTLIFERDVASAAATDDDDDRGE
jgi:D-tyrosyl-tRNA(Tyr) deacylase